MSKKNAKGCSIRVLDKEYVINCDESEKEMLLKSADFLNERIKEIRSSGSLMGGERIMVMTALNISYDYLKARENSCNNEQDIKRLQKLNRKVEAALHENKQIELS